MAARNSVKSVDHHVKESLKKVSDEDLRWLAQRFKERIGGDLADALTLINDRYSDLNRVLVNTPSSTAVFDVADIIDKHTQDELKRRSRPSKEPKEKEVKEVKN